MADLGVPFRLSDVDGVPCFWADMPGPCSAGLLFRVGRADELLSNGGLTAIVQRLALAEADYQRCDYDARVDATTTSFYAGGDPGDVANFLALVCRGLAALPLERLESDKRVLGIEDERELAGLAERLLMMRYGAAGYGLPFYEQLGLRWVRAEHVSSWAAQWFTRGNAALWMTCPPPAGLRLDVPDGMRVSPPHPQVLPGLELPAFAAAGEGPVASATVAARSAALTTAARSVAERLRADPAREVTAWQLPLAGSLSHRHIAVEGGERPLDALVSALSAVAAEGPTREELADAVEFAVHGVRADEAVPGNLDRLAVDELLGAPRRWKEDVVREAQSVSYAEAAAALREALTSQLLLAPADAAKPAEGLHDYPWFSPDRVQGSELKPAGRAAVRLVVGQDGVSHVTTASGRASTVRFRDVAAAVQEPDGSLTLIGRDGAIVPIDPAAFRGAGQVVSDLERTLPRELVIPPRDAGGLEHVARRKLRPGAPVGRELRLLHDRLDHGEEVVTLCTAIVGFKFGLLALTDRRVIWLHLGPRDPLVRELPYGHVIGVDMSRVPSHVVTLRSPVGETAFSRIDPKERAAELVDEIRKRVAAAQYEMNSQSDPSGSRK